MKKGIFITIEGCDGCGKTTQKKLIADYLSAKGLKVLSTREPGGANVSEAIRGILLSKDSVGMTPMTEALLYAAARSQHVSEIIKPAVQAGTSVVCDRFLDSSIAYQGWARELTDELIVRLFEMSTDGFYPDITFWLDLSAERAFGRKGGMDSGDRIEAAGLEFHRKVYAGFLKAHQRFPNRIVPIDATKDAQSVFESIRVHLDKFL